MEELNEAEKIERLRIKARDHVFVFLYGVSGCGKTAITASLLNYMSTAKEATVTPMGSTASRSIAMINNFKRAISIERRYPLRTDSTAGVIEVDVRLKPFNQKYQPVNFTFLEISGEHLEKVDVGRDSELPSDINVYFNVANIKMLFLLASEYDSPVAADAYNTQFVDYITMLNPKFEYSNFLLVVTKWDRNTNTKVVSFENYVNQNLAGTVNSLGINSRENNKTPFSLGPTRVVDGADYLIEYNPKPAKKIWDWLYAKATGRQQNMPWWERWLKWF